MSKYINIAIDGHSSCGKSTISKSISKQYNMRYIDTGSMYRAITLYCIENNLFLTDNQPNEELIIKHLPNIDVNFVYHLDSYTSTTYLNGDNVEDKIRGIAVSSSVSLVARLAAVRKKLIELQQNIAREKNVVMDGRDIGTKVLPLAELKFFITADVEVRAKRRYDELIHTKHEISYSEVLENLKERDRNDSNRLINPLRVADDAILIDNSTINFLDQNRLIFNYIDKSLTV